jgi:plastocyanin
MRPIGVILNLFLLVAGPFQALADERMPVPHAQQVTVKLSEYRFEPAHITLKAGKEVELTLVNEGAVMHEFITDALKDLEVDVEIDGIVAETHGVAELEIPTKAKVVLRFTPEKTGEFPVACHAKEPKDHLKEGMIGKLAIR